MTTYDMKHQTYWIGVITKNPERDTQKGLTFTLNLRCYRTKFDSYYLSQFGRSPELRDNRLDSCFFDQMSDHRNVFMVFRISYVASLAFWASCGSVWFIRHQASVGPVSQLPTTTEEPPSSKTSVSVTKSEYGPSVNSVAASLVKIEKFIDT